MAAGNIADDFASPTNVRMTFKKNVFSVDLRDAAYYPYDESFYAAGDGGTMLVSDDGVDWQEVTNADIAASENVMFKDMYSTNDLIAVVGVDENTGSNYVFLKHEGDAFERIELTTSAVPYSHQVKAVAISDRTIFVTTDTPIYYYSYDAGATWGSDVIHSESTGSSAIGVDGDGNMVVFNNGPSSVYVRGFAYDPGAGSWNKMNVSSGRYVSSEAKGVYREGSKWVAYYGNDSAGQMLEYTGTAFETTTTGYIIESVFVDGSSPKIMVGWTKTAGAEQMIIRSADDPATNPLYELGNANKEAFVDYGRLYGVAGGETDGSMVYVAVGSGGTILRSTDGAVFEHVEQVVDTSAGSKVKHIASGKNGHAAVITEDNRLYYSIDGGQTWTFKPQVGIAGEVGGMLFYDDNGDDVLYILTNDLTMNLAYAQKVEFPDDYAGAVILNPFRGKGISTNQYGAVFYGNDPSPTAYNAVKIYSYKSSGPGSHNEFNIVPSSFNAASVRGDFQLLLDIEADGSEKYAFISNNLYLVSMNDITDLNNRAYKIYDVNVNGSLGTDYHPYIALAEGNERQVLMNAGGEVRVFRDVIKGSGYQYRDELIYTGKVKGDLAGAQSEVEKVVFASGVFVALTGDGNVYTSYDGIHWTLRLVVSWPDIADMSATGNSLLFLRQTGDIQKVRLSYDPYAAGTVVKYPEMIVHKPDRPTETSGWFVDLEPGQKIVQVDLNQDVDPTVVDVGIEWYIKASDDSTWAPIADMTDEYELDLADLDAGLHDIRVEVTYRDASKTDQPENTRVEAFRYGIRKSIVDVTATYSATEFEIEEGGPAYPITVTIKNTGEKPINGLSITASDTSILNVVSNFPSTLNVNSEVTAYIQPKSGLAKGTHTAVVMISDTDGKISKYQIITVNVANDQLDASVDKTSLTLPHNAGFQDAKVELTLENTGNRTLYPSVTLSDNANFELSGVPATLLPGVSVTAYIIPTVRLQPDTVYHYTVTVNSDAGTFTEDISIEVEAEPQYDLKLVEQRNDVKLAEGYTNASDGELRFLIENYYDQSNKSIGDISPFFYTSTSWTAGDSLTYYSTVYGQKEWWFKVTGQNRSVDIETVPYGPETDTYLELYDANLRLLRYDDDSGGGNYSRISSYYMGSGTYYIKVRSYNGTSPVYCGIYLSAATPQTITTLGYPNGGTSYNYFITGDGRPTSFETLPYGTLTDTVLELYNSNGQLIASDDDYGTGAYSLISKVVLNPGQVYRLHVRNYYVNSPVYCQVIMIR
ncbi:MAG: hypothetical protein C6W55_07545 [Thermobacillus sp.]|uniref:hypothetical protein n=1 Tax=Thermobacillus sp. TaxID=2108467 RepID=UPI000E36CBA6|nr:hypothetical protein [Thermobacillus sp.]REK56590.1 MAG: hypothetical protein C6W55_07545 [Thermobacillus sp.]